MEVHDAASAAALAAAIDAAPRHLNWGGTSISGAVLYALERFDRSPMPGVRRVIDISGDGANNSGRPIAEVRDEAVAAGVTINGLPILWVEPGLAEHYRDEVIGGHGAFMIAIDDYEGFAEAIQRKLVSEIAGIIPSRFAARHWPSDWLARSAARSSPPAAWPGRDRRPAVRQIECVREPATARREVHATDYANSEARTAVAILSCFADKEPTISRCLHDMRCTWIGCWSGRWRCCSG